MSVFQMTCTRCMQRFGGSIDFIVFALAYAFVQAHLEHCRGVGVSVGVSSALWVWG